VKVHPSALKHGVAAEDAIQAAEWPLWIEPLDSDDPPERELRLGFDSKARLLEIVVLVSESGDELVIHAMPARKQYWEMLPKGSRTNALGQQGCRGTADDEAIGGYPRAAFKAKEKPK
jgi:hypothetical protein